MKYDTSMKVISLCVSIMISTFTCAEEDINVFYPSAISTKDRATKLKKFSIKAQVFADYKDFLGALAAAPTKLVIAPETFGSLDEAGAQFEEVLPITKDGKKTKMVLLALDESWKGKKLNDAKIGVVSILDDKDKLKNYFGQIYGEPVSKLKTVTKPEDLFPLLVFKSVDMIMINPENLEVLKQKFQTKVFTVKESSPIDFPKLFIKKGENKDAAKALFQTLDLTDIKELGF